MRRFDLHQDKAEKKSKELFYQMVVVQAVTLLVSGLVLGAAFTLMFFLVSERHQRRMQRRAHFSNYQSHEMFAKHGFKPRWIEHKGPLYDYVINEDGRIKMSVVFGVSYLSLIHI